MYSVTTHPDCVRSNGKANEPRRKGKGNEGQGVHDNGRMKESIDIEWVRYRSDWIEHIERKSGRKTRGM